MLCIWSIICTDAQTFEQLVDETYQFANSVEPYMACISLSLYIERYIYCTNWYMHIFIIIIIIIIIIIYVTLHDVCIYIYIYISITIEHNIIL